MEARKSTDYITFVIVVSAIAVLTLHTNNCFWFYSGKEDYWFSANIIECVFYFAVPLFFMVSGITLMDFFDRYSMKRFFARRFMKTMLPFLVWSLVALAIDLYTGKRLWSNISIKSVYQGLTGNGFVSVYWFFYSLFILYLCMPLYAAVEKSKRRLVFSYLVIAAFVFNIFLPFLKKVFNSDLNVMFSISALAGFLIWPLLGWLLHNYEFKRWHKALIHTAGLIGLALHVVGTYHLSHKTGYVVGTFKGYENVPSVLYATSVFVFLKDAGRWVMEQERLASFVKVVGRYAFEIYLLQFILLDAATRVPEIDRNSLVYRLGAPLVMIPVIIAFTWCLRKIPVVRRIVP
ncbi:acyltransferase family protein [Fibrobacter sp.]|uniref:acyltransferase n=1 Tax=Fibrobacter sp. TaxID=35828 RepID=UPI00262842FB|nr:acyltransferase family protein [Fibrobacter sp.]MDD5942263.1 acyltransferase family protein [Fibrobacter sp.]